MSKRVLSSIAASCALLVLLSVTACTSTPGTSTGAAEDQMMLDLNKRYANGELTKEAYDRERSEIQARAQRESLQSGSPMNETIRGFAR